MQMPPPMSFRLDSIEMALGAEVEGTVGSGVGSESTLAHFILRQHLKRFAGPQHCGHTVLALNINLAVGVERRRPEGTDGAVTKTLLPMDLASPGVEAAGNAPVGHRVKFVPNQKRR